MRIPFPVVTASPPRIDERMLSATELPPDGWHRRRFAPTPSTGHLSVNAVVRLRWWAILVQVVAVSSMTAIVAMPNIWPALLIMLGAAAVSNVALSRMEPIRPARVLGAFALLDVVLLTALLSLTGGPTNPFSVLYLIFVMLAAITTVPAWTWATVFASSAGFGLLFFVSVPLPPELGGHAGHGEGQPYAAHLQGMWLAHTVTAAVIARFVGRLSVALNREREHRAQTSRTLGLATLAAGAAHEIGNPLATIQVAASELEGELANSGASQDVLRDLDLIDREVRRAHRVLEHMSIGAGELVGEGPVATDLDDLMRGMVGQLGPRSSAVRIEPIERGQTVRWPIQATTQALTQLIRNAVLASPAERSVGVRAFVENDGVQIWVTDRGPGMPAETLERIGEPFFTTRPGQGQGLGVFIARSLVEHLGGAVEIDSAVGRGTIARVWLPREAPR